VNKTARDYSERQLLVQQQVLSIDKLSSVIDSLERDMHGLKSKYEAAVEMRNYTGIQVVDRNDELVVLYEKSNVHEKTLGEGEKALQAMADEVKGLSLSLQEYIRQLHVARLKLPDTPMWAERILELQNALVAARGVSAKLSGRLETPATGERWVALDGEDPETEQIQLRAAHLEDRLNLAREELLERELVLEELRGVTEKLAVELHGAPDATGAAASALAKQVNEMQARVREATRKLMALVSESAMYQATAIKLSSEAAAAEQAVEVGADNLARGLAPSLAAEQKWSSLERQLAGPAATLRTFPDFGAGAGAAERPNAYISQGEGAAGAAVGAEKPYHGVYAPFKPSEPGASMRHFRNPEPKPIEI
jgi:chromosome segregation ATPase